MERYRHIKKHGEYQILAESKMKIGQIWVDCIVYQSMKDGKVWVREQLDFEESFEKFVDIAGYHEPVFSACVLVAGEDGTLLSVSRKDDHNDFGLPGGKVDEGETVEQCIIREVREETGLELVNIKFQFIGECLDKKNGLKPCAVYTGNVRGEINYTEPHIVKYNKPSVIVKGSFGEFNKKVFKSLRVKY